MRFLKCIDVKLRLVTIDIIDLVLHHQSSNYCLKYSCLEEG